MMRTCS